MEIIRTKNKDEFYMRLVYLNAAQSKDPKTKIGAVLVKDDAVISQGFNGFARGVLDLKERYNNRDEKYMFVCHGETNAITTAARHGINTLGSTLYTQGIPCADCCKNLIQAGVYKFVVHKQWPNLTMRPKWVESNKYSQLMIKEAQIQLKFLDALLGMEGFLDGEVIHV